MTERAARPAGIPAGSAIDEHQFPTDSRDSIFLPGGALTAEAVRATDVSVVFLLMMRRHLTARVPRWSRHPES